MQRLSGAALAALMAGMKAAIKGPSISELKEPDLRLDALRPRSSGRKGKFPQGKIIRISPPYPNPAGNYLRNPKIGAQMNAMHDAWYLKKFGTTPAPY